MFGETGAFTGRRVAGADADLRRVHRNAHALGHVADAGERGAQVAFDVDGERLQRREVDHADAHARGQNAGLFRFGALSTLPSERLRRRHGDCRGGHRDGGLRRLLQHQPVQAPQECGERFPGAGGCENQRGIAARDGGPALTLRLCGPVEDGAEPRRGDRVKLVQNCVVLHLIQMAGRYFPNRFGWDRCRVGPTLLLCRKETPSRRSARAWVPSACGRSNSCVPRMSSRLLRFQASVASRSATDRSLELLEQSFVLANFADTQGSDPL